MQNFERTFFEKMCHAISEVRHFRNISFWLLGRSGRRLLIMASFLQILLTGLDLVFLALILPFINSLAQSRAGNGVSILRIHNVTTLQIYFTLFTAVILKSFISSLIQYSILKPFAKREAEITTAFVKNSIFEKADASKSFHSADLLQAFTSLVGPVFNNLFGPLISFIDNFCTIIVVTFALFYFDPLIGFFIFPIFVVFGTALSFELGRRQKIMASAALEYNKESFRLFNEIKMVGTDLKLAGRDQFILSKLFVAKKKNVSYTAIGKMLQSVPRIALEFLLLASVGIIILVLRNSSGSGSVLTTLGVAVAAAYRILPSLNSLILSYSNFKQFIPTLLTLENLGKRFNYLNEEIGFDAEAPTLAKPSFHGDLVFSDVRYRYPNANRDVFTNFNLRIREGSSVVLEGANGSGKSTLISLALGNLDPQEGKIFMQKNGIDTFSSNGFSDIGYLAQDVRLLDESYAYNIALRSTTDLDEPRLVEVTKLVGLFDRIGQDPIGLRGRIGENGGKLSSGERQRLGLARALFFSPRLVICDEPTSNLDSISEKQVWDALLRIKGEVSMLIVSHRPVPLELFDLKVSLDVGA